MTDDLTPLQRAAAFHGLAGNRSQSLADRLSCALQALEIYEDEVARLTPSPAERWAMPTWMRRYVRFITHDAPYDASPEQEVAYVEDMVSAARADAYKPGSAAFTEALSIHRQVHLLDGLREVGVLREPLGDSGALVTQS